MEYYYITLILICVLQSLSPYRRINKEGDILFKTWINPLFTRRIIGLVGLISVFSYTMIKFFESDYSVLIYVTLLAVIVTVIDSKVVVSSHAICYNGQYISWSKVEMIVTNDSNKMTIKHKERYGSKLEIRNIHKQNELRKIISERVKHV